MIDFARMAATSGPCLAMAARSRASRCRSAADILALRLRIFFCEAHLRAYVVILLPAQPLQNLWLRCGRPLVLRGSARPQVAHLVGASPAAMAARRWASLWFRCQRLCTALARWRRQSPQNLLRGCASALSAFLQPEQARIFWLTFADPRCAWPAAQCRPPGRSDAWTSAPCSWR